MEAYDKRTGVSRNAEKADPRLKIQSGICHRKTPAEDITRMRFVIDSPYDEGYKHSGDKIDLTIAVE